MIKDHRFLVYLLHDNEEQEIHAEESKDLDFSKIVKHLEFGGSVFITHRVREIDIAEQICEEIHKDV